MAQLESLYTSFPTDRSSRRRLNDQLHKSLTSSGISADLIALAEDSSRVTDFRQSIAEELSRITALHHSNSGANIRLVLNADNNIVVKKGLAPAASSGSSPNLPQEWLDHLRRGYESSVHATAAANNTSGMSPSPAVTTFATAERPSGGMNDSYCPFSTPPEFRGFDASPLAAQEDIGSPNVLD